MVYLVIFIAIILFISLLVNIFQLIDVVDKRYILNEYQCLVDIKNGKIDNLKNSNESLLNELKQLQIENAQLIAKCVKLDSYNNELSLGVNLYIDELAEFRKVKIGWNYFEKDVNGKMKIFIKLKKRKS